MTRRTLAVCVAHPDDETYTTYGSVGLHADDPDFRLVVLHATDGDAGEVAPGVDMGPDGLGALRRLEDERAWRAVGRVPDRHEWLGVPDGTVAAVPVDDLTAAVARFLDEERPDVVITFGPDGITGHPDHVAVGVATDAAFHQVRRDGGPGLRRLLHSAIGQYWFTRHQEWRIANGFPVWDPERLYHLRAVPDERIHVDVRTGSVGRRLLAGLREHRSQAHVLLPPHVADASFLRGSTHETHTIAWPPRGSVEPRLRDVFEGLG
ncbi:PIG-L deacetylase family protein [Actinotalea sp. Marseille-Q4924]|uniref:PIG-L deacetylase family protein n=1 Tax=Actinotalea sp. Marseille-Q4924 TaxID=2866571 RepID=UPI001CE42A63|nr:PIG-L family deacetylase [Actinotalea sp. Marseille-Q4924]